MFKNEIIKVYAEMHGMTVEETIFQYCSGLITQYELFEAFLNYEGIYGYTAKIITAFRECFDID